jgi:O-antigen/teichoic acid export membrane protein
VGGAALSLLNVLVIARTLGPVGRGDVAFLTTIGFLVPWLVSLGIDQANVNLAGRQGRLSPALATNSLLLAVVLGVAGAGLVALLVAVVPAAGGDADSALRWLVLASMPMLVAQILLKQLAAAFYGFVVLNVGYLVPPALNLSVNAGLALLGKLTVATAVIAWLAGQVVATLVAVGYVLQRLDGFGRPDSVLGRRQLSFGLRAHAGRVMLLGNYRIDQWILGAIAGSRELGLYSIAVAWAETLFFLPNALASVQRPDLVRAAREAAARQAAAVFRFVIAVTAILALVMVVAAPILCTGVFGESFGGSVDDLRVLVLGAFGIAALKLLGSALTARDRPLLESAAIGVAFVAILALDFLLIPGLGGLGAAIASMAAYSAGGVAVMVLFVSALGGRAADLLPRVSDARAARHMIMRRLRRDG